VHQMPDHIGWASELLIIRKDYKYIQ